MSWTPVDPKQFIPGADRCCCDLHTARPGIPTINPVKRICVACIIHSRHLTARSVPCPHCKQHANLTPGHHPACRLSSGHDRTNP